MMLKILIFFILIIVFCIYAYKVYQLEGNFKKLKASFILLAFQVIANFGIFVTNDYEFNFSITNTFLSELFQAIGYNFPTVIAILFAKNALGKEE